MPSTSPSSTSRYTLFSFLIPFLLKQRMSFFFLLVLASIWPIDQIVFPYIVSKVIDILNLYEGTRAEVWKELAYPVVAGFLIWILIDMAYRVQGALLAVMIPQFEADVRMQMFDHVQRHSPRYFQNHLAGSLSGTIGEMTVQASQIIQLMLVVFLPSLIAAFLTLLLFFQIAPLFALCFALWLIGYSVVCWICSRHVHHHEEKHGEMRSLLSGRIVDSLTNSFTVNSFNRFDAEKEALLSYQEGEKKVHKKNRWSVEIKRFALSLINLIGLGIFLLGYMFHTWVQAEITTGQAVQIFNTVWNVVMIAWVAGTSLPAFFQALGLTQHALKLMNDPQDLMEREDAKPLHVTKGEICFEGVSFGYGKTELFHKKNIVIHPGEKIGLVGKSGAGKSTFIRLLMRLYPVKEGRILIDGQDIAEATLDSLRKSMALIPQDPMLFQRTIFENIHYGNPLATEEEVYAVAKKAHCESFIQRMPQGYQTLVGERGSRLSGGERQRIAIARALLANTPILLLDEATSALDSITEQQIQESLELLMEGRTTLLIAHRLSTLAKMDRIFVFDRGAIVESGTPKELLGLGGHYTTLWNMQSHGFLPNTALV